MIHLQLWQEIATILLCAAATVLTRGVPFFIFKGKTTLPPYIIYLGKALPSAIFALLIVYCLKDVNLLEGNHGVPEAIGLAVTVIIHLWKRQMMLSMLLGMVCYMGLVQFVFTG